MKVWAEFAVKSKYPGDVQDYRVLVWSKGRLGVEDFERFYKELTVGTMPSDGQLAGECPPPWVTVGTTNIQGCRYVVIIRQEWTGQADGRGHRPIAAMSCLCIPYQDLAENQAGLLDVYRKMPPYQTLLQRNPASEQLCLSLAPTPGLSERLAHLVDEVGYDFVAAVAALLLDTSVALVKGGNWSIEQRLAYLDAIVSLLPYGSRADLSVSTWAQSASMHNIHLSFSDSARSNQKRVVWGNSPSDELLPATFAHRYYTMLHALRNRYDTIEIIRFLARQDEQHHFQQATAFLRSLQKLDRPYLAWKAVHDNRGSPANVRALFQQGELGSLTRDQQRDLLVFLLDTPDRKNLSIVDQYWQPGLGPYLYNAAKAKLAMVTQAQDDILSLLSDLALQKGILTDFLEAILAHAGKLALRSRRRPEVQRAAVYIFQSKMTELQGKGSQRILPLLTRYPPLLYEFILQASRYHEDKFQGLLPWLASADADTASRVKIFQIATGSVQEKAPKGMIDQVAAAGHEYVRALFRMADDSQDRYKLKRIAPAVTAWLLENQAQLDRGERHKWQMPLRSLKKVPSASPELRARVDLLHFTLDATPSTTPPFFNDQMAAPFDQIKPYVGEFVRHRPILGAFWPELVRRLARFIEGMDLYDPHIGNNVLYLLAHVAESMAVDVRRALSEMVVRIIGRKPELLYLNAFAEHWQERLAQDGYISDIVKLKLKEGLNSTTPSSSALTQCAEILCTGGTEAIDPVLEVLEKKSALTRVEDVEHFWEQQLYPKLQEELPEEAISEIEQKLILAILEGRFGDKLAMDYRERLVKDIYFVLKRVQRILPLLEKKVSNDEWASLERLAKDIHDYVKRKIPWPSSWR